MAMGKCCKPDCTPAERDEVHETYKNRVLKAISDLEQILIEESPCDEMLKEGVTNYFLNAGEMVEKLAIRVALLQSGVAGDPYQGGGVQIHPPKLGGLN